MELWNDFEGKTVDGRYPLQRLLAPKGRSALFETTDEAGAPAVIRLIESLNDEGEILRRWTAVRDLHEEHLTQLMQCNQTVLDGVHLVYAVMEPFDAELADVLKERSLTSDEAKEMAGSIASALQELHAHGLVHEHVESSQVVARGEVIKLRSDLVREAGEGSEAAAMRRRDAHDLAVLIQESVTRRREGNGAVLPAPLDEMVRNGRSGAWGVSEMAAVLRPAPGPWASATGTTRAGVPAATASSATGSNGSAAANGSATRPAPSVSKSSAVPGAANGMATRESLRPAAVVGSIPAVPAAAAAAAATPRTDSAPEVRPPLVRDRIVLEPEETSPQRKGLWAVGALALLGAILLFWHFLHSGKAPTGPGPVAATPAATTAVNPPPATAASGLPLPTPSKPSAARAGRERSGSLPQRPSSASPQASVTAAGTAATVSSTPHDPRSDWRVVAFTYNREDQAQHKAAALAQQHPDLKPEVFAPKGGSPYLVAIGGWMSSADANALRDRARNEGLPHDTYVQNFKSH